MSSSPRTPISSPRTPIEKEVTSLLVAFEGHPDAADLKRRLGEALGKAPDAGELLDVKIVDPGAIWPPARPMGKSCRRWVGWYLIVLGVTVLAIIPWAWSFASAVINGTQVTASFFGLQFTPTAEFSMVFILLLTAILGSVAVLALTFSDRAGYETLERGFLWWYLTRPISAAGLGLVFYMAVFGGFFDAATAKDRPALIVAAAIGGIAGLFTDQVLMKMRKVLGLLPPSEVVSGKGVKDTAAGDSSG
jgi:hypothetical protein